LCGDTALTRKPLRVKAASIVQAKIQGRMRTITPPSPAYVSKYGLIESKWFWYWHFTSTAKFIESPPGTGFDCYRHWEAISMGSIPIILHSTFDRTFAGLPVVLVDSYKDVSVPMLDAKYKEIVAAADKFDFSRLTAAYWVRLIQQVVSAGNANVVQQNHPLKPKYTGEYMPGLLMTAHEVLQ